jgi:tryptophanyl-tRNA synthetase
MFYHLNFARALLNPLRGPRSGPDEIGFAFHWASIQQGEPEAFICKIQVPIFEGAISVRKIALSGIKPTGTLHIGNYLGMIKPAFDLVEKFQTLYFVADYHALTTLKDKDNLNQYVYDVAATLLALGLDPQKVIFFRQSDILEIFEFTWILNCFTAKGLLNRAHAYKAEVDANIRVGKQPDADVNAGLYDYPVLMAADILLYGSHFVPVGQDQRQHVEIARDIALAVNNTCGEVLTVPEALIQETVMTIPGIDGRKMSKNYNNTIPIFTDAKALRKQVMRIVTDSTRPQDSKNPDECNVFNIFKYFAPPETVASRNRAYLSGGLAYSEIKQELYELLNEFFGGRRDTYTKLLADKNHLDRILNQGADRARAMAAPVLESVRRAIGISR